MTYALHHLRKPTVALREIRRVMFPKGRILIADFVLNGAKEKEKCNKFTIRGYSRC